jgi:pilus assembly protein Flp/PilA
MLRVYRFIVNREADSFTMRFLSRCHASNKHSTEAPMLKQMQRFLKDESGAAAIEYGLIVSGISVAIIPGVKSVGAKLVQVFTILQNAL